MKKQNLENLKLNKNSISNLNAESSKGGITTGCTDGCTPFQTAFRCSHADCTNDCGGGISLYYNPICGNK